jgi:gentisate 1,2-dioxygenase
MATPGNVAPSFDSFDNELKTECMEGHWIRAPKEEEQRTYGLEPHTRVEPFLWKWDVIHRHLMKAGEVHGLEGMADRRTLRLINPAFNDDKVRRNRTTTHTIQMSVQLLKPGELASSHRHNFAAFRFVVEGQGAYTVVDGEKFLMEVGDLILNPPGHWHGHGNDAEPIIWLDGLDYPLVHMLQTTTWEAFPGDFQNIIPDSESNKHRLGHVRPTWEREGKARGPLCFKWKDTYETLSALKGTEGCPYNGISLEYINPIDGGSAFATMGCEIALLREGEKTKAHRHRHTVIYHAFRGEGTTVIDGQEFKWKQGDCFVVPLWAAHSHENRSKTNEAILFSMNDMPMMKALKLWKEEAVAS